jgi:uncharacterized protein YggE
VLGVALGAAACAPMGPGGHHPRIETVSVAGSGAVSAAPDMAEITGYEVTNQVRVKVRDLGSLGRVLDQQVGQGANQVHGVQFGRQEPAPLLDEARKRAMADARRKADLYAAAAGLKVGRVVAVQEAGAPSPREMSPRVVMSAAVPVAPGEQEIHASVTVTFTLEP